jgi:hypothetical protein
MKIPEKVAKLFQSAINGNVAAKFFGLWMGRCTFFSIVFSVVGLYGWLRLNRDLTSFALFAGAIQALLLAHSYKQDVASQKQDQSQVVEVNVQK